MDTCTQFDDADDPANRGRGVTARRRTRLQPVGDDLPSNRRSLSCLLNRPLNGTSIYRRIADSASLFRISGWKTMTRPFGSHSI